MSPDRVQVEQDRGDAASSGEPNLIELQWAAVDAYKDALSALDRWIAAYIKSFPVDRWLELTAWLSAERVPFQRCKPVKPANVLEFHPVPDNYQGGNRPYWGE